MLTEINTTRAEFGLSPLSIKGTLSNGAAIRSAEASTS